MPHTRTLIGTTDSDTIMTALRQNRMAAGALRGRSGRLCVRPLSQPLEPVVVGNEHFE